jgi:hypothetical protein
VRSATAALARAGDTRGWGLENKTCRRPTSHRHSEVAAVLSKALHQHFSQMGMMCDVGLSEVPYPPQISEALVVVAKF